MASSEAARQLVFIDWLTRCSRPPQGQQLRKRISNYAHTAHISMGRNWSHNVSFVWYHVRYRFRVQRHHVDGRLLDRPHRWLRRRSGVHMGTLGGLFGDIPSLIGLLVAVLVLCLMAWGVRRLSMTGHHNWVVICFLLGLTLGGLILWVWVDWSSFGFGFGPFIILVVATAVEAILIQLLANRRR